MKIRKNIYSKKEVDIIKKLEYSKGFNEGVNNSIDQIIVLPLIILRDKYGFGAKRLGDFVEFLHDYMDYLSNGDINIKDVSDVLKEETGIEFKEFCKGSKK